MKKKMKIAQIIALTALIGTGMLGCLSPTSNDDSVTITLTDVTTAIAGQNTDVSGEISGNQVVTATYAILDANGDALSTANAALIKTTATTVTGEKEIDLRSDADLTIEVGANAVNGTYILAVTATAGAANSAKYDTFTVTGGVDGTLLSVTDTGKIANIAGPDTGAYDLVNGVRVASSGSATVKDLLDLSLVGDGFAGELGTGNGAKFVAATAADYTSATAASVKTLGDAATATSIAIAANTVFAVKLGSSRGYAIVKILTYSPTAGASTGANKGEATFEYKFTAN